MSRTIGRAMRGMRILPLSSLVLASLSQAACSQGFTERDFVGCYAIEESGEAECPYCGTHYTLSG